MATPALASIAEGNTAKLTISGPLLALLFILMIGGSSLSSVIFNRNFQTTAAAAAAPAATPAPAGAVTHAEMEQRLAQESDKFNARLDRSVERLEKAVERLENRIDAGRTANARERR